MSLTDARKLAGSAHELVARGIDPRIATAATQALQAKRTADTVESVVDDFIRKHTAQHRSKETERILRREVIGAWGSRPITSITRRDVVELVDRIAERAPVLANRTLARLKTLSAWALDRDIIEADPTARVRKPTKERARERILTDAELAAFWQACDRLGWPFGALFKLLALTGQRKSEIGELRWSETNLADELIEVAGERYKTGRPHVVPLSSPAAAIVRELPRMGDDGLLVFTTTGDTPVSGFSRAKATLDVIMETALRNAMPDAQSRAMTEPVLKPWTLHDLRRTARTNFSKLGVSHDVGERVIGHVLGGVRGVYDRYEFLREKRDALDRWAAHLFDIVEPRSNAVLPQEPQQ